jgi:hypothetical protein
MLSGSFSAGQSGGHEAWLANPRMGVLNGSLRPVGEWRRNTLMKNLLYISVLALPLLLLPSRAHAWGCNKTCCIGPATFDIGFSWHYKFTWGGCGSNCQAGPWYSYWPYDAHFAAAAPLGGPCYPGWPGAGAMGSIGAPAGPMGQPVGIGAPAGPMGQPVGPGAPAGPMGQPVGQPAPPMPVTPPVPSPAGIQHTAYSAQVPAYWFGR